MTEIHKNLYVGMTLCFPFSPMATIKLNMANIQALPSPEDRFLLEWYVEAGVDEVIQDDTTDHFVVPEPIAVAARPSITTGMASPVAASPQSVATGSRSRAGVKDAEAAASACSTLQELRAAVEGFEGCSIKKTAMNTVFADGNPDADVMFIGEAPGAEEDRQGVPFCGPSGQLLDKMLASIGLSREQNAYITNTLFWRPPGNRKPSTEEVALCAPFVKKHIALFRPKMLVLVGGTATSGILEKTEGISRLRGKFYEYTNDFMEETVPVGVLFHPSYLLRQPSHKRLAWQDLLKIQVRLKELGVLQ